jgi:hypothetical protein
MKGETAIGTDVEVPFGQHGACELPMMMVGRRTVLRPWHPDQISSMESRGQEFNPDGYKALIEEWQCPCGCTKRDREI